MQRLKFAAAVLATGCLCAALPAGAAVAHDVTAATITVVGEGRISRAPDLATVAVTSVTNDDNATRALSENNRRYAALVAKLGAIGVGASDITSTSVQSYFDPRPSGAAANAPGQLYGYVVNRSAQISVTALLQTGAVVDAATAAGATQIGGVSFGIRDRRAAERAALAAAVADASAQAQAIASAAHVQIVRVLQLSTQPGTGRVVPLAMSMARTAEAPVPTTISPSDLDVTSTITVTYEIR
jgi:uncharacterized protein YggE